jgi:hypothetical protein
MQTKQELIKHLQTQNCYDFLNANTAPEYLDVALPPAIVENLKRVERTLESDEQVTAVWHFPAVNCYVKFEGEQSSYDGTECNDLYLVEPVEKTVIVYE